MTAETTAADGDVAAWARSGAMHLTGRADGPGLGPPARLVPLLGVVAADILRRSTALGVPVDVDPLALLTERAALLGMRRRGDVSCGGASRIVQAVDGYVAVTLARADDLELIPAWLGIEPSSDVDEVFEIVRRVVRDRRAADVVAFGAELGLAVAELDEQRRATGAVVASQTHAGSPRRSLDDVVVVDLSSLWAGPLCTRLLVDAGATVIKVESTARPDGARFGDRRFFDLMNAGKQSVALDLASPAGRDALRGLVHAADVVVEASRPRALEAMGIDVTIALQNRAAVWLSITGHGRDAANGHRIAFGDDAAVAGGAVVWDEAGPCFCGDAIADPITGMIAAAAVLDALGAGGRWILDVALARCAALVAGPTLDAAAARADVPAAPQPRGVARALGQDTAAALAWAATR